MTKKRPFWGQKWFKNGKKLEKERKGTQKKKKTFKVLFAKERFVLTFISVQCKRTFCSFRSFPFFRKELK